MGVFYRCCVAMNKWMVLKMEIRVSVVALFSSVSVYVSM